MEQQIKYIRSNDASFPLNAFTHTHTHARARG
jgi:hypothetical protein